MDRSNVKRLWWGIGLVCLLGGTVRAQVPQTTRPDSVQVGSSTLLPVGGDTLRNGAPLDTTRLTAKQEARIRKIVPKKASVRSAILPGLGQIYNGQWWKTPLVYGGFGALIYFSNFYRGQYKMFREYGIKANYAPGQETVVPGYGTTPIPAANLERAAISARRYRDYNYLGMLVLWAVNIVDANVTAHLKTFDVSEDLSMKMEPSLLVPALGGPVPGFRVAFQFKK